MFAYCLSVTDLFVCLQSLTPPPSPFSSFQRLSAASRGLEAGDSLMVSCAQEYQLSMSLPHTPSKHFEAMLRPSSCSTSMSPPHTEGPINHDCRPTIDPKENRELVSSH